MTIAITVGVLLGLIVIIESYIGEASDILIVGIGSYYTQQELLMKECAVGVAGI